ncbi:hypothetical protein HON01_02995 [Candidatus Woesearchaeota archaeon]|jgi:hypothetical protein|nr:hypothetical protein [Candidatus Woesearchaeota archaeon]MBT7366885.1 hypothetical protein [Candidatus Woesearchaeota archaeon]
MLDQTPKQLYVRPKGKKARNRTFNEIPILFPGCAGGFGDLMNTLKLGEGLKQEFPDKEVCIYFLGDDDYALVKKLYPHFNKDLKHNVLNGISVAMTDYEQIRKVMGKNKVGVYSPVACIDLPRPELFFQNAGFNFYVEEYDMRRKLRHLPGGIHSNELSIDQKNNKHLVLRTGFDEDSSGIHIDKDLLNYDEDYSKQKKLKLLKEFGLEQVMKQVPGITNSEWTVAYYAEDYFFRMEHDDDYLKSLYDATLLGKINPDKKITIFDFSKFDPVDVGRQYFKDKHLKDPFVDFFVTENKIERIGNLNCCYDHRLANVRIVHLGNQTHDMFINFLKMAELPVCITGDASLAEAISADKIFFYNAPGWKSDVNFNFRGCIPDLLNWKTASDLRAVYGCDRVKPEHVENYPEIEAFYLSFRDVLSAVGKLGTEARKRNEYSGDAVGYFTEVLKFSNRQYSTKDINYFKKNKFALGIAALYQNHGLEKELEKLKFSHLFRSNTSFGRDVCTEKLFYHKKSQSAFHKFNHAVARELNLSKNLANLIRVVVETY